MARKYVPPVQKGFGQFLDCLFLLVLVYLSLLAPLLLKTPETAATAEQDKAPVTWQQLDQNATMEAQWQKLGYDAEKAKPIVTNKFDYSIEPISLILTVVVILGYFIFVLRISDKEYREVIAEKFDQPHK